MRWIFCCLLVLWPLAAMGQSPIPNDPFLSVPPPTSRPRPVEPAPRPAQPRPEAVPPANVPSRYPVPVGQSFRDCAECPEMMVIPAGSFMMGSPASEEDRERDEGPQRRVSLNTPLAVGRFEVTFAEWDACHAAGGCRHRPSDHGWGRGNRPVINVTWDDAQEYVRWLSQRSGRSYRLLTEAEWEYAARGGTTTPYFTGTFISATQANFENSGLRRTQPVSKRRLLFWHHPESHWYSGEYVHGDFRDWPHAWLGCPLARDDQQPVQDRAATPAVHRSDDEGLPGEVSNIDVTLKPRIWGFFVSGG